MAFKTGFLGCRGRPWRGPSVHVAAGLRPCRTSPKKAAPQQRVLDGSPAAPGRRHGPFGPTARGSSTSRRERRHCDSLYVCCRGRRRRGARSDVPAELHAGGPLTGRRRCSVSSIDRKRGERHTERKREPGPPRRRRAAVSHAMAVSARRALWRTGFGFPCCRVGACAEGRLAFYFARPSGARRRIVPTRPPATARYV